jgi:aminopeptidase N
VTQSEGLQTAFQLDSLRSSHPIEVPVRDALEVDQIFDHISYLKGSSVIRMLSIHLGVETFLKGVSQYLKAHAYGNATTADLWSALGTASGQDINSFMDPWIRRIGFPLVTVSEEPGQIILRQSRFLITGDVEAKDDETTWWIPLGLSTITSDPPKVSQNALTSKKEVIRDVKDGSYKLNQDSTGFFRVNYSSAHLAKLGEARRNLSIEDKIGLIGDATATAKSGDASTAGFLALIEKFEDEDNYLVWQQILNSLNTIRTNFAEISTIVEGLRALTLKLLSPAVEKIGWEFEEHEDFLTGQLRSLLISQAGSAGHDG